MPITIEEVTVLDRADYAAAVAEAVAHGDVEVIGSLPYSPQPTRP